MPSITQADAPTLLRGVWARTIEGIKDGVHLEFENGEEDKYDGAFLVRGRYVDTTLKDDSIFTARLSIITPPSVKVGSVSISMFQARKNTYAASYCRQGDVSAFERLHGSYLDVRGDGGSFELEKIS